ncbi:MAG: hypothetical protein ACR2PX_14940 [Endozoicomonas sp.]|uniref:hypothetical protein n=1 Tax=Endozoicomonas sp. TaxID=1892382 RepID=UPI003D9AE668
MAKDRQHDGKTAATLNPVSRYFLEKILRHGEDLPFKIDFDSNFYIVDLDRTPPLLLDTRNRSSALDNHLYGQCRVIESMMLRAVC